MARLTVLYPHGTETIEVADNVDKVEKALGEGTFIKVKIGSETRLYNTHYILAVLDSPTVVEQNHEDTLRQ